MLILIGDYEPGRVGAIFGGNTQDDFIHIETMIWNYKKYLHYNKFKIKNYENI